MTLEIIIAVVLVIISMAMVFVGVIGAIVIANAFNQYWGDNHDTELHNKGISSNTVRSNNSNRTGNKRNSNIIHNN